MDHTGRYPILFEEIARLVSVIASIVHLNDILLMRSCIELEAQVSLGFSFQPYSWLESTNGDVVEYSAYELEFQLLNGGEMG